MPSDVRDRAIRRTGRVIQAMNALHDVLAMPEAGTEVDKLVLLQELDSKLQDMAETIGYDLAAHRLEKPTPLHDGRAPNTKARPPAKARLPKKKIRQFADGSGLPFQDL